MVSSYVQLRGSVEPDEITNDVFLGAFSRLESFAGDESALKSWLLTIAHRRLVDERRRRARTDMIAPTADISEFDRVGGDSEQEAMEVAGASWVRWICADLPSDQRDVVFLRAIFGLSLPQTAEIMGRSVGAIKQLQHRGLRALRSRCEKEGVAL